MVDKELKVYCETTVIGDMTSRPSPLVKNLARKPFCDEEVLSGISKSSDAVRPIESEPLPTAWAHAACGGASVVNGEREDLS